MRSSIIIISLISIFLIPEVKATLFLQADADLRYSGDEFKVEALGLSMRKVFADRKGDRIILFGLFETMHNFKETMLDQVYLQYKGPLGRWNFTAGRYILPFGLLPNYSTKRLLIKTLEEQTLEIASDNGLLLSGVINNFDYAISLSQGVGVKRWTDIDNDWLVTARVGYQGIDFEDLRIGLSALSGRILPNKIHGGEHSKHKQLLALDLIKYHGLMVWRSELTFGEVGDKGLNGIFTGVDYALFPRVDINLAYTHSNMGGGKKDVLTMGVTYNLAGFQLRAAQKLSLRGEQDEFSFQVYRIFAWTF